MRRRVTACSSGNWRWQRARTDACRCRHGANLESCQLEWVMTFEPTFAEDSATIRVSRT